MLNLFDAVREIHEQDLPYVARYVGYRDLLRQSCHTMLRSETIRLSDDFSRLTFLAKRQKLTDIQRFGLWQVWKRPDVIAWGQFQPTEAAYLSDLKALVWGIAALLDKPVPRDFQELLAQVRFPESRPRPRGTRIPRMRVVFQSAQLVGTQQMLICDDQDHPSDRPVRVRISSADENDTFKSSVDEFWPGACLHLIDVLIPDDETDLVVPRFVVLEPDYLVNVTDLAETFSDFGESPLYYLMKKLEPMPNKKALLLGNMANFFLDELLNESADQRHHFLHKDAQTGQLSGLFIRGFSQQPLPFTTCTELQVSDDFSKFQEEAATVLQNLRATLELDFPRTEPQIRPDRVIIEPAFLSADYGVQGRLDMLQRTTGKAQVVELKAGKAPWPPGNLSLMKPNHESQLLLYRLMIQSASDQESDPKDRYKFNDVDIYVLYASATSGRLRSHAPLLRHSQRVMQQRNRIVAQEYRLANDSDGSVARSLIERIGPDTLITKEINDNFRNAIAPQMLLFKQQFARATPLERSYVYAFVSFISAELFLSKTGGGAPGRSGHASLWRDELDAKVENGCILFDLFILTDKSATQEKEILFEIPTYERDYLPNFRKGDVCVLYERNKESDTVLKKQVFKCTIAQIDSKRVRVRLRFQQSGLAVFNLLSRWALEPDSMDNGYVAMYKSLYTFLGATPAIRSRLLTLAPPAQYTAKPYQHPELTPTQNQLIANALAAPDYYLVIGPPGTGKTRIMLANLVTELHRDPTQNILLLAYTNRAVDEICEAVTKAIGSAGFIRIGSALSCEELYHANLMDAVAGGVQTRSALKQTLDSRRVFIATIASLVGCMDLFDLKPFNVAIVDEASQILEPQLVGLLTKVEKFILIGDQKQLPAIVLQTPEQARVPGNLTDLHAVGLHRRDESYFERLLRRCQANQWTWAYGMLDTQARMHVDLAMFPNHSFYSGKLNTRPDDSGQLSRFAPLTLKPTDLRNPLDGLLATRRLLFFPSGASDQAKLNHDEARLTACLVERVIKLYAHNGRTFDPKLTVGVITPYRRQIALIRKYLRETNVPYAEEITVDTVERYQGSQRDVIIYSFAVNSSRQLDNLRNDYYEDDVRIDRKLNVAITRARQQMIYIGTESVLTNDRLFYRLFEFVKSKGGYVAEGVQAALKGLITSTDPDVDQTVAGKLYTPSVPFEQIFDTVIAQPIRNASVSWPTDFGGFTADVCRNLLIEYGRANFEQSVLAPTIQGQLVSISPAERVQMYGLFNLRKHYFTTYAILESYTDYFYDLTHSNEFRIAFVDIGCGPMTSGMAFQQFLCTLTPNFGFMYFGIDRSSAMLDQAKAFSQTALFSQGQRNWFGTELDQLPEAWLADAFQLPHTVIINTCYLFGNLDVDAAEGLAVQVNQLMQRYPLNRYVLVQQNPKADRRNRAYYAFRKALIGLANRIASKVEQVSYRNQVMSRYDKTEEVFYEILSN